VARGARHFSLDPRYNLQSVAAGFADRPEEQALDRPLLERIRAAYVKAASREQHAEEAYRPTSWWALQRQWNLGPVIRALTVGDIEVLGQAYRNFYRDPCSGGLITPQALKKHYFSPGASDFYRRLYLVDTLYRLDYWKSRVNDRFSVADLGGPCIGNPFGAVIEGTLVRVGAEYQHYCAQRIGKLVDGAAVVAEVGGGFGGTAYYLLRDRPGTKYLDFDVPESVALTSYYLLKAFPNHKVVLYGEKELTEETVSQADVVLMPAFAIAEMPRKTVDITFSSHALADLSRTAADRYLRDVHSMTKDYVCCIGSGESVDGLSDLIRQQHPSWTLVEAVTSDWHAHRATDVREVEFIYRIDGA
jgi:hypothetical protein